MTRRVPNYGYSYQKLPYNDLNRWNRPLMLMLVYKTAYAYAYVNGQIARIAWIARIARSLCLAKKTKNLLTLPILIRFWLNLGLNNLKFGQEFISEIGDSSDLGNLRNEFLAKFTKFTIFADFDLILTQFGSKQLKICPGIHFWDQRFERFGQFGRSGQPQKWISGQIY